MPTLLTLAFTLVSLFSFLTDVPAPPPGSDAPPPMVESEKECVYVLGIPIYCK